LARDEQDRREVRDPKFEVQGSKFRQPRTSNHSSSRPSRESRLAILLEQPALLEVISVNDRGWFGGKLSPFLQQTFDLFPNQVLFEIDLIATKG